MALIVTVYDPGATVVRNRPSAFVIAVAVIEGWQLVVPGPAISVLEPLLRAGLRIDGTPAVYCADRTVPRFDRYVPGSFALLCALNCIQIGIQEQRIDRALEVESLARYLQGRRLWIGFALAAVSLLCLPAPLSWGLAASLAALAALQLCARRLPVETFRVLADAALLLGPLGLWLCS